MRRQVGEGNNTAVNEQHQRQQFRFHGINFERTEPLKASFFLRCCGQFGNSLRATASISLAALVWTRRSSSLQKQIVAVCVSEAVPVASAHMARSGLGKGLGALIGTPAVAPRADADSGERVHQLNLASIVPSTLQPRKDFAREALQELIDSIRQHGIIQPLIVRQVGARFELIAGERRWRAAQEVGQPRCR